MDATAEDEGTNGGRGPGVRFATGHRAVAHRQRSKIKLGIDRNLIDKADDVPCPDHLKSRGLEPIFRQMVFKGLAGDSASLKEAMRLAIEIPFGITDTDKDNQYYDGNKLPVEIRAVVVELDCCIAEVVKRFQRGLPCSDMEAMLAESAIRVGMVVPSKAKVRSA